MMYDPDDDGVGFRLLGVMDRSLHISNSERCVELYHRDVHIAQWQIRNAQSSMSHSITFVQPLVIS